MSARVKEVASLETEKLDDVKPSVAQGQIKAVGCLQRALAQNFEVNLQKAQPLTETIC